MGGCMGISIGWYRQAGHSLIEIKCRIELGWCYAIHG